ncbi:MAG: hypothetical protein ABFS39_09635 [Pseudomonadota bacterium]
MSEGLFIKRQRADERTDSFASLRREGIELAQQFSGELWTDYNLHDPGVTILEQLAYAITELIYRADFPVADLLSGEDGIDYARQALYAPELIFPCRPTTLLDYRKAILNAVSELDNCWLLPIRQTDGDVDHIPGLYKILLKLDQDMPEAQRATVLNKVRRWYQRHRNLCEDLAEISFAKEVDYELCARVEVGSAQRPEDVLAEIYFNCARRIAGSVALHDYAQAQAEGLSLEEIFSGPFTNNGLLMDDELAGECEEFLVSTLYAAINKVEGVDHISTLHLERDGVAHYDSVACGSQESTLNLRIPQRLSEIKVVLIANGRIMPVTIEALKVRIDELNFRYYSSRSSPQELSTLYTPPKGNPQQFADYYSIQNQFPVSYGIGSYGIPESAPADIKARAKQLKAYLLIFEQIMANYLANLNAIPSLFSIDKEQHSSYSFMALSDQQINGLKELYPDNPGEILAGILADFDDHHERRSRLLDYLLALYGESFAQHSLRHFNYYFNPQEVEERIVENKIDYLKSVVDLGRDRAAAGDCGADTWSERAVSGLQRRVGLLLGFQQSSTCSLVAGLLNEGLKLARHQTYEHLKTGSHELEFIELDTTEIADKERLFNVPLWEAAKALPVEELREHIGDAIPLKSNLLSDRLLRQGIYIDRYQLFNQASRRDYQLCFQSAENQYWTLGCYPDKESGIRAANCLRHLLVHLNSVCEGLHLLEHILLRPFDCASHGGLRQSPGDDFYPFRISVLFPAWTARCHDPQFRLLAEETVHLNTPSHIHAEFYWLDFHEMYEFESLYEKWLSLKCKSPADAAALNPLSGSLIKFLQDKRKMRGVGASP